MTTDTTDTTELMNAYNVALADMRAAILVVLESTAACDAAEANYQRAADAAIAAGDIATAKARALIAGIGVKFPTGNAETDELLRQVFANEAPTSANMRGPHGAH